MSGIRQKMSGGPSISGVYAMNPNGGYETVREQKKRLKARDRKIAARAKKQADFEKAVRQARFAAQPKPTRYQVYLATEHWRLFRMWIVAKRGARCEDCGSDKLINLHHLTYARLGNERDDDVRILCRSCHQNEHKIIQQKPSESRVTDAPSLTGRAVTPLSPKPSEPPRAKTVNNVDGNRNTVSL